MQKTVLGVLVGFAVLVLVSPVWAYQVDRNILLTYGDEAKNYTEAYFDAIVQDIDVPSLTEATLTVYLSPAVNWGPTAMIWVNGDLVEGNLPVSSSTAWTYDVLADLQNDGGLTFKVEKKSGTLYYHGAELDVTPDAAHNPIPATLWLFGVGLMGLAGIRKKFRK